METSTMLIRVFQQQIMSAKKTNGKILDQCAYLNCYNGRYTTGHKLFRFPRSIDPRHELWIKCAGNPRLRTWSKTTRRRAGICADHFDPKSFTDKSRRALRRNANPKPYNAKNAQAEENSTRPAQIKSLPQNQTNIQEKSNSEDYEIEFEAHCSQIKSDTDEPENVAEKPMLTHTLIPKTVKSLRKVTRIKIEERVSNTNRTMILERCKNPENCPAKSSAIQHNGKPRPHFHKVYVNNAAKLNPMPIYSKPTTKRKPDDENSVLAQGITENFEEGENNIDAQCCNDEITKRKEKHGFRLETIHIDLTKPLPKKDESSTTSRYTGEPEDLMSNWQVIQKARAASELEKDKKNDPRKPSRNEFIEEYYKSKEGCSFDRCVYVNCKNGRFTTGAHLFRFPQIEDPRLLTWMKNAGNPKMLHWTWSTIRRAGLCADHFTKDSFFNEYRQRLLRTAIPKPFWLEENASAGNEQTEKISRKDLLKVLTIIENERKKQSGLESGSIDLPSGKLLNRDSVVIRYPFAEPGVETDKESKVTYPKNIHKNDECLQSSPNVIVKTEIRDQMEDNEYDRILAMTSGMPYIKEEPEDYLLDDVTNDLDKDSEDVDDVQNIVAVERQKARLWKLIKQFSTKLENARIRKLKLHARCCPPEMRMTSFG